MPFVGKSSSFTLSQTSLIYRGITLIVYTIGSAISAMKSLVELFAAFTNHQSAISGCVRLVSNLVFSFLQVLHFTAF